MRTQVTGRDVAHGILAARALTYGIKLRANFMGMREDSTAEIASTFLLSTDNFYKINLTGNHFVQGPGKKTEERSTIQGKIKSTTNCIAPGSISLP
jgi:hypothetical protein